MRNFANQLQAAIHHLNTVPSAKDDREAVRRLITAQNEVQKCIDDLNELSSKNYA